MTSTRTILVVLPGEGPLDAEQVKSLNAAFDLRFVNDAAGLGDLLSRYPDAIVLGSVRQAQAILPESARAGLTAMQFIGLGVGVVNAAGNLIWTSSRLAGCTEDVRKKLIEFCQASLARFNAALTEGASAPMEARCVIDVAGRMMELTVWPALREDRPPRPYTTVVGAIHDVTASQQFQQRLNTIHAAGQQLLRIDPDAIAQMSMAERLWMIEDRIVGLVHDLLHFENFEIRLINRQTNQLELAVAVGIAPLKVGEAMYATESGNGISGLVAVTGRSYFCTDAKRDPNYREGLENAASTLTVPLKLHDLVIGIINAESTRPGAFSETDRLLAEALGTHIAAALNILTLLINERCATTRQTSNMILSEVGVPLDAITREVEGLVENPRIDDASRQALKRIIDAVAQTRERVTTSATAPRTILDAEHMLRCPTPDPALRGKHILVADDEPAIRDTISQLLKSKGCEVTMCADGRATIAALNQSVPGRHYDLIISDIRMPDRNGYEVFQAAKDIDKSTAIILMTGFGYDPHHSIVRASQEGLHSFLFKPFKASQLMDEVSKALAGRK